MNARRKTPQASSEAVLTSFTDSPKILRSKMWTPRRKAMRYFRTTFAHPGSSKWRAGEPRRPPVLFFNVL